MLVGPDIRQLIFVFEDKSWVEVKDAAQQVMTAHEIAARKLSVREAERLVARTAGGRSTVKATAPAKPRDITRLEERLSDQLAAAVPIWVAAYYWMPAWVCNKILAKTLRWNCQRAG